MKDQVKKALGLWTLTSLVIGNMVGSGIFLLPSALARIGSVTLLSWLFTAGGALLLALVFAKLSSLMPRVGGPYAYCREGFGDFIGFQIAFNYWLAICIGSAAVIVALMGYVSILVPAFAQHPFASFLIGDGVIWLLTLINVIGVREGGIFQLVSTVLKLLPLLGIAVIGLFYMDSHNIIAFNVAGQSHMSAFTAGATLTLWSFIGLESATIPAGDVNYPQQTIPRATIIGTLITATIYILCTTVIMALVPQGILSSSTAPFAEAAKAIFGHGAEVVIVIGAIISCMGSVNGWILLQGQIPKAAAEDHLLPSIFKRTSQRGTPVFALVLSSCIITLVLGLNYSAPLVDQFTMIIKLSTLAFLLPYLYTTMAQFMLTLKYPEEFEQQRSRVWMAIALLAFIYAFWAVIGSGAQIVFYGTLLLFSSIPVYVWVKWE